MKYMLIYLLVINIVAFAMMGIDKSRARNGQWRISEASLFLGAILGGSIGSIAGMQLFRHKTKHWYFQFGMPAILMIQLILVLFLYKALR